VYLDNSSTTKPCVSAIQNINTCLEENWGNPSSLHSLGVKAESALSDTRSEAARILSCDDTEIYFTSGGTEANNLAVFGTASALVRRGKRIVTTSVEHPSVLEACNKLECQGFEITRLHPDSDGNISEAAIKDAVTKDTILVSMMLVNNEIGTIYPIKAAAAAVKAVGSPALIHCDAVQAFGKMNIKPKTLGIDLMSISGHKIHGPKGVGILYKSKNSRINPHIFGGHQEKGLRSGTEPVPAIAGLLGALTELDIGDTYKQVSEVNAYAKSKLGSMENIIINSSKNSLPFILNFSVVGFRSETILHFLESRNVYVSSGSACAKGKGSYVLREMGLPKARIDSAIRVSFSRYSSCKDVDILCESLADGIKSLRRSFE